MNKFKNFIKIGYRPMPILKSYGGFLLLRSPKKCKESWGIRASLKNILIINGHWYFEKNEFSKFKEKIGKYVIQDSNNLMRIINKSYKERKILLALAKKAKNAKNFSIYRNLADQWWSYIMIIYGGEDHYENYLKDYLRKKLGNSKKTDRYFNIFVHPIKENVVFKEKRELLKIGSVIQKKIKNYSKVKSSDLFSIVYKHFLKYQWLSTRGYYGKEWGVEDVISRIRDFLKIDCQKELEKIVQQKQKNQQLYQKVIRELKPDRKIIKVIETAKEFLYFRTYRTDVLHQADFISRKFLLDLCTKHNFKYEEIVHLTRDEIYKLANKEFSNSEIQKLKERCQKVRKNYVLLMLAGKIRLITDDKEIESIRKAVEVDYSGIQEFKGVVANTGRVQGVAKIIESNQDIKKVRKGDIIAAAMTHPNYIVAMEKAAAFVTDEGGLTCHAAIVSRELNIPCIIGTKIATKVLRDGDLVEVDADKGIVRILKSNS